MRRWGAILLALALAAPDVPAADPGASAPAAAIPFREDQPLEIDLTRITIGAVLMAAAGGFAWYLSRRRGGAMGGGASRGRRLRVVERLRLSPRTTLVVVEFDGRTLLLAEQPGALLQIDAARAPAANANDE
jgi:flagellar biogenesis protein FliO